MKKLMALLLTVVLALSLVACGSGISPLGNNKKTTSRTEDISDGIKNQGDYYFYSYDLDFDGEKEEIEIEVDELDDWEYELNVRIGNYEKTVELYFGSIEAVYACDIDTNDNAMDIAIFTCEESGDPRVRIFKYDENLTLYEFYKETYDGDREIYDCCWTGYAINYYLNVNDDDTITIEEQTSSAGMWSVHKTYKRGAKGRFEEIKPEKYEILPDFMNEGCYTDEINGKEKSMWNKGFIKAYVDYEFINEGEYFKVLYDDGKDNIYIETQKGKSGWIYIGYEAEGRYDLNPYYFYLAG